MAVWKFSKSEQLRNKIVDPAWYVLDIQAHRDWIPSKDGQSNICHFDTVIVCNADTGDTTFAGVPIELLFSDKPGAQGFREAFMHGLNVEINTDKEYNMYSAVGQKIEAFVENNEWQGRISNRCNHKYRPVRK